MRKVTICDVCGKWFEWDALGEAGANTNAARCESIHAAALKLEQARKQWSLAHGEPTTTEATAPEAGL